MKRSIGTLLETMLGRTLLILPVLACLVGLSASLEDAEAWRLYKEKYNKTYGSSLEDEIRMKVYLDNLHFVQSHNTKSTSNFKQAVNPLSDLTTDEILRTRCGFRLTNETNLEGEPSTGDLLESLMIAMHRNIDRKVPSSIQSWFERLTGPEELDWRNHSRVSKVKDQGSCGSCWAFASTGALEGILASQGKSLLLSEQNLVDCSSRYGNKGCNGGLMMPAFRYVRDHGIMSSHDYPYKAKQGNCTFKKSSSIMSLRGSIVLPTGSERLLRMALSMTGPIPIAVDASPRSFHNYKSGVYDEPKCRSFRSQVNHAMLLVGYGKDPVGGPYWLVKNSWGSRWGDHGYIKLARNHRNQCGVASYAVLPIPR